MASIPSFIFGGNTKYKTQEELEAAREAVRAMLGDIGHSGLTGWGSALADIGKGIGARIEQGRIDEGQAELLERQGPFSQTLAEIGASYGGASPDAIVATSGADTLPVGSAGTDPVAQALARPPESPAPRGGGGGGSYLRYANKGATRNKPLAPKLEKALSFLSDLGVTAEVFSGGQDASGPHRTGSHRHDYGNAGDIRFYKDGRPLSWANKADLPIFQEIVRRGKAAGITGFGAGPGYMGEGTMHVGFGTPSVWGAGGRSRNAPGWLTDAYSGQLVGGGGASAQAGGGAGDSFLQARPVPARNVPVNEVGLRTPQGQDFLSRMGNPAPMAEQQLPMVPPDPRLRMVNPASMSGGPQPLPMVPGRSGGPMPPLQQPVPPPPPAPTPVPPAPAPAPAPPAPPAPPPQVDPFTNMILGDKAAQFKPGNYIPPAPLGKQVFPAAPPAPGTPAAAGFGVPPVVGGGGADQLAGKGTFPPAPPPPQAQGGPQNVVGKLMTILASPFASDEQKRMAAAMLNREYALEDERRKAAADAANPMNQLDMEYKRAQIAKLNKEATEGGSDETFFGNPILINKPGGGTAYGIYGNKGTFKEIALPEGTTVAPPTKTIDTETETVIVDQAGNVISRQPKNVREAAKERAAGTGEGKTEAEVGAELSSIESKMPGLREVVTGLGTLADEATYTQTGQMLDYGIKQLGMDPRDAAVARSKYNAIVSNQILPLLRDTFGAQFTAAEGVKLEATLGDPDMSPTEKHAVLNAFIQQKERDIAALRARKGNGSAPAASGGGGGGAKRIEDMTDEELRELAK